MTEGRTAVSGIRIVIVMGVSGSGKSTVGRLLADRLGWRFQEGDDLHPPANIEKMKSGLPLDDEDRKSWLAAIERWLDDARGGAVITCSALRRAYREQLTRGRPDAGFLYLRGSEAVIAERRRQRGSHFMPLGLLHSQFETLEEPDASERIILTVDIERRSPEQIAEAAKTAVSGGQR